MLTLGDLRQRLCFGKIKKIYKYIFLDSKNNPTSSGVVSPRQCSKSGYTHFQGNYPTNHPHLIHGHFKVMHRNSGVNPLDLVAFGIQIKVSYFN